MKFLLCFIGVSLSLLLLSAHPAQATEAENLLGDWVLPDGSAVVHIETSDNGLLKGRVRALLRPNFSVVDGYGEIGTPRLDIKNSDKSMRHRPVIGLEITSELDFDGEVWQGKIYDPGSGKLYRCHISLEGENFARVRGYVGFSLIGRSMYWQRLDSFKSLMHDMLGHEKESSSADIL